MKIVWASSPDLEQIYLQIKVSEGLGILVEQENREDDPTIIFCSLFPHPQLAFEEGRDTRRFGVTVVELKAIIARIEVELAARAFR